MLLLRWLPHCIAGALVAGCAQSADDASVRRGDTLFIQSQIEGPWGSVLARETDRITGPGAGQGFGQISCLAVGPHGQVAVFDKRSGSPEAIHLLDSSGRFTRSVGREGSGPGEYSLGVGGDCLEYTASGALALLDRGNGRLTLYPSHASQALTLPGIVASGRMPHLTSGGDNYVYVPLRAPQRSGSLQGKHLPETFVRADPVSGDVDTLPPIPDVLGHAPIKEITSCCSTRIGSDSHESTLTDRVCLLSIVHMSHNA